MRHYFPSQGEVSEREVIGYINQWSYPLRSKADLQPLFDRIGEVPIVMLGEASHGTHEYYTWRSYITRK
ncbi:MAG: erythromycin esterase family protein, partial [Bacteroidota bacterium]|nr:erythromycin esterase family protein [Bacteroidota bacterium]